MSLDKVRIELGDCIRCPLHQTRTNIVFGVGNPQADILLVGEGPGANEDQQGEPFVGQAGHLLNRLLEKAGLARSEVYIANVVKCRPPGNRDPKPEEVHECLPFLTAQIKAIQPRILVTLGKHATWYMTNLYGPMGALYDNTSLVYRGDTSIPVVALYHPSYLLRQGKGERAQKLIKEAVVKLKEAREKVKLQGDLSDTVSDEVLGTHL